MPVLEAADVIPNVSGGTTINTNVDIPPDLEDSVLELKITWFSGVGVTVDEVRFDGSDAGVVEVGTQVPSNDPGSVDGLWMGYVLNPTSGTIEIGKDFSAAIGSIIHLSYKVWSGVNQASPVNAFFGPSDVGVVTDGEFFRALTTTAANCALSHTSVSYNSSGGGTAPGMTEVTPRENFITALYDEDLGATGNHDYIYTAAAANSNETQGYIAWAPAAGDEVDVVADHAAFLPVQDASVAVVVDVAADHSVYLATMDATAEVVIEIAADHSAYLPGQDAAVDPLVTIAADHAVYLPGQDAAVSVEVAIAADHSAFLPTQDAIIALETDIDVVGDHSVFLPTQDAIISVRIDIAADHAAFLPTMTAAVTVGETSGVLLNPSVFSPDGALPGSVGLDVALPSIAGTDATLPGKSLINVTLAGAMPSQ